LRYATFAYLPVKQAQFSITVSFFYNRDDSQISVLLNFYLPLRTTGMDKLRRHLNGQCGMGGMEQLEEQGSIMADKALSPPALLHGIRA
jgi:hypothetical protein